MPGSVRRVSLRAFASVCLAVLVATVALRAQIPGRNINMVAGTEWPGGDPFLQRQNEPSMAASTRNPLHLVGGSNDYRTVDVPGLPDGAETGDAWVSVYKSFDGGQRWSSTLLPGYPQDTSPAGVASPIKGYQAAADPVLRAGTSGLIYYNGLVFDRGEGGKSGIFLARFIDRNNKENGDPIAYLGTSMVVQSPGDVFLDKPWMAVDIPRGNGAMCVVGGQATGVKVKRNGHRKRGKGQGSDNGPWLDAGLQYVEAGAVYVAYTVITGQGSTLASQIFVKRSLDCGVTWSQPMRVSQSADQINQGAALAISPLTGDLFVAWRRFSTPTVADHDAVMVARLRVNGGSFDAPGKARGLRRTGPAGEALAKIFEHRKKRAGETTATAVNEIDQGTSPYSFRTNAYPTIAVDGTGRAYIAWSERGFATAPTRGGATDGDARIMVATTTDGRTASAPVAVDDGGQYGHQLMPSLTFAGGKLLLLFYDLRETRAGLFGPFVSDQPSLLPFNKRQTIDIRASLGTPGATPSFAPSVRVSDYIEGYRNSASVKEQLQVNPPNLPMFRLGTVPFIGDYIDVAPSPAFVPTGGGGWAYNTAPGADFPVFHAVWTDNRDVRPPLDGNWQNYTPPTINGQLPGTSLFDPSQTVSVCLAGNAGSRNQNIYTARISGGLLVGSPGNTKPLSPTVQRGFVVFAQNQTTVTKRFRMTVLAQPPGGRASFEQFPRPGDALPWPAPTTVIDVKVPARSTASRTVYATSTDPKAQLEISVLEVELVSGGAVSSPLAARTVLNPDIENPDIENPDIENPDIENPDIENAEVYNPDIENPDIENPDIENPDIENPDIENPDIENIVVANPDIENIGIATPDIENPDIENPDIENPDIENPDIENGTVSDVTWTVSNIGNTTSAFNVNVFLAAAGVPSGINTQLVVYKTYKTPVLALDGCTLKTETRNVLQFNVPSPNFVTPGKGLPDQNDPSEKNATLWLNPGEIGRVTLRVYDNNRFDNVTYTNPDGTTASIDPRFNPATVTTVGISGQGVDVLDPPGATEPPAVTTTGTNLFFLQQPADIAPATLMAPVRVRVWDNTGAPLDGVNVTLTLCGAPDPLQPANPCPAPPAGVLLSGATTALADVDGIASFGALSVTLPATGLRLRAAAAAPGVVAAGTSAPFDVTLAGGPVSLWRADGNTLDSVGGNHGALQGGAGYAMGRIGPGFNFSNPLPAGTRDQHVLVPDDPSLRTTNQMTMSAWIYPTGPGTGPAPLGVGEGGIIVNKEYAYEMARFADGSIRWAFGNGVDSFAPLPYWVNSGGVAPLNTWTHVAVTYNTGTVTTFINGVQVSSISPPGIVLGAGTRSLRIGGRELYPGGANFDGRIDEVGIQNRALTLAEVQALYTAALPQSPASVSISNVNAIFDGTPKPVTVTSSVPAVTLYNSSTTVPSAIGAYYVQAIVNQNGFTGAAGVNHKIASTLPAGGNGGGPYERYCGSGVFANGVRPSTNSYYGLGGTQLLCTDLNHPARVVGTPPGTYTETALTCPSGQVMVGLHGQAGPAFGDPNFVVVANMGPRCQPAGGGSITDVPAAGGGTFAFAASAFSLTCPSTPSRQAVTGVVGGIGEVVDSIALVCGALPVPPPSLVYTVPAMAGGTANTNCPPGGTCEIGPAGAGGIAPVNTGVSVSPGSSVTLSATGQVVVGGGNPGPYGPAGTSPYAYWPQFAFLEPSLNQFALVARIGAGPWQLVGNGPTVLSATGPSGAGGVLELAVNDSGYDDNTGSFAVTVIGGVPPAGGAITSVSPASTVAAGFGQMLTINGTALPTAGAGVIINQGGIDVSPNYTWSGSATRWIVRLPGLSAGPATVRVAAGAVISNAFPITISTTPAAPVLTSLLTSCAGGATTTVLPGGAFSVEADGIDTYGLEHEFVWTPTSGGSPVSQTGWTITAGPTGRVCTTPQSGAAGVTSGSWTLQLRTSVSGVWSALSNAVAVTVP